MKKKLCASRNTADNNKKKKKGSVGCKDGACSNIVTDTLSSFVLLIENGVGLSWWGG